MEREMTRPPAAAKPCMRRHTINVCISLAYRQATVDMTNNINEMMRGVRRPSLSLSGPIIICPVASPNMLNVRVSCTNEVVVSKLLTSWGSAGR